MQVSVSLCFRLCQIHFLLWIAAKKCKRYQSEWLYHRRGQLSVLAAPSWPQPCTNSPIVSNSPERDGDTGHAAVSLVLDACGHHTNTVLALTLPSGWKLNDSSVHLPSEAGATKEGHAACFRQPCGQRVRHNQALRGIRCCSRFC